LDNDLGTPLEGAGPGQIKAAMRIGIEKH